jgi:hypothetical protein
MPDIQDGEELTMTVPDRGGVCFFFPPSLSDARACASISGEGPAGTDGRLVASGAVRIDGVPTPVRFALRFSPEENAVEPTADGAREFAVLEANHCGPAAGPDAGGSDAAAALDLVAVGRVPVHGAPAGDLVALGSLQAARASFGLDLRSSGHDAPVRHVAYAVWSHQGMYALSVEGDEFHADAVDAFADESARTLSLRDPAPPAPSDAARIGFRLGQTLLVALVLGAVILAVLGGRNRRK